MGILKIIKQSPPEEFDDDIQVNFRKSIERDKSHQLVKSYYPYFWGGVLFSATILCILGVLGYWLSVSGSNRENIYAYFELKVFDHLGQPVAGARVYNKKQQIGVTDTYGEWRRFMKTRKGGKISFRIAKQSSAGLLTGQQTFELAERYGNEKEPELIGKVQLELKKINKLKQPEIITQQSRANDSHQSLEAVKDDLKKDNSDFLAHQNFYNNVWFSVAESGSSSEFDKKKTSQIKQYVVHHLKEIVKKNGVKVDPASSWQVVISHLGDNNQSDEIPGLIRVISNRHSMEEKIDFLRNYTGSAEKTALVILQGLKSHVNYPYRVKKLDDSWIGEQPRGSLFWYVKAGDTLLAQKGIPLMVRDLRNDTEFSIHSLSAPCEKNECLSYYSWAPDNSPRKDWQIYKIKVYGFPEKNINVYVSGIKAKWIGSNTWQYWGTHEANMYLSVVLDQKVVGRRPFLPKKDGNVISFPSQAVGRKSL